MNVDLNGEDAARIRAALTEHALRNELQAVVFQDSGRGELCAAYEFESAETRALIARLAGA